MLMAMALSEKTKRKDRVKLSTIEISNNYKNYSHRDSKIKKHNKKMNKIQRKSRKINRRKK
jgi:hypothetical protein